MLDDQEALYIKCDINRSAVAIKPKQAFFDWLKTAEQAELPLDSTTIDVCTLYLVKDMLEIEEIEKWLKKNFEHIFLKELFSWHTAIENYPQKLTFKMFQEWFDYKPYTYVVDLGKNSIEKFDSDYM